jgi:hypothetical protein
MVQPFLLTGSFAEGMVGQVSEERDRTFKKRDMAEDATPCGQESGVAGHKKSTHASYPRFHIERRTNLRRSYPVLPDGR